MKERNRILSFLLTLAMIFTCAAGNGFFTAHAADGTSGTSIYTTKGTITKIFASAFAQNTDDWTWMDMGNTIGLAYQDVTNLNSTDTTSAFAKSNSTANFGINIADGNLAVGDSSVLKFHIGTVTIKANGYADLVINLNKDYSESYTAEKASWGITGNTTQVLLNNYLPTDATAKANYLRSITNIKADITLSDYQYSKPTSTETGVTLYTKGAVTKIFAAAFTQNTTSDWTWMSLGQSPALTYQNVTNLSAVNSGSDFAKSNSSANFGINISDSNLADGDGSTLKFHIGTVTVKATGYSDLVINLNKDYSETFSASKVSWGLTGNTKQVLLNDYLPTDATAKTNYLQKITSVAADITLSDYTYIKATPAPIEIPADYTPSPVMRNISSMDLVKDMKVGWNLGNTLESTGGETGWGNPKTTRAMIDTVKKAGFSTVRIPVRWDENYIDSNYTIDPAYLDRVETVVKYAFINDMYVIINIHHNKMQSLFNNANKDSIIKEGTAVWTQLSNRFKNYGDKLVFDVINEPRNAEDWVGQSEYFNVVNEYNAKMLSVIRATGGNNATRLIMMPTYCAASNPSMIAAMSVPTDKHVAVSIHAYIPYNFALNEDTATGSYSTFGDSDKAFITDTFKSLDTTFRQKGIPVVIGEFGAIDKNNLQDRINFTKYYTQVASSYGIPCCWWDNSNSAITSTSNGFALLNRKTLTFIYPDIVKAMMDGWNPPGTTPIPTTTPVVTATPKATIVPTVAPTATATPIATTAPTATPTSGGGTYPKGAVTKIFAAAFAQNTTSDWTWMNLGQSAALTYQNATNLSAVNSGSDFAKSNSSANFGINIADSNLADGDGSTLKFHIGTVTIKATGYSDIVINLNKDYSETFSAAKVSWGLTGNTKQILLNSYLPTDATAKTNYLQKITSVAADITLSDYVFIKATPAPIEIPADYTPSPVMRNISSMNLVKDMKVGWNLGNTLESTDGETGWGNPKTTRAMIDTVKKAGFNTIRIPVRWDEHYTDSNYTIDPAYLDRVETVVKYAFINDMYVIINIHHNKMQGLFNAANKDSIIKEGTAVWTQLSNRFKNYGDKLAFDVINEPRSGEDWTGTSEYFNVVNEYNAKMVSVIRATGGNNASRLLLLATYCAASNPSMISAMSVPTDNHVAVSIHAYIPYNFALNTDKTTGSYSTFGDSDKTFISDTFKALNQTFIQKGIPVVIGEFGAIDKNNLQDRINFTKYYTQVASSYGIPCCWWDNGNSAMTDISNDFALLNRKTLTFIYPDIVKAMMDNWKAPQTDILGDVDGNGTVDTLDFTLLKTYILNRTTTTINRTNSDMNKDGAINSIDLALLKRTLISAVK